MDALLDARDGQVELEGFASLSADLVDLLDGWIQENDIYVSQWRIARGYLLAEQGRVKEAIDSFEPLRTMASKTGCVLLGESQMTRRISFVAACRSNASRSSRFT